MMFKSNHVLRLPYFLLVFHSLLLGLSFAEKPTDYSKKSDQAKELFQAKAWDELEQLLSDSLISDQITSYAVPVFSAYTDGLTVSQLEPGSIEDLIYTQYYASLKDWQKAYPDSIFTKPLEIDYWTTYGWEARGSGVANTVTEDGWDIFGKSLAKAKTIYDSCVENGEVYPNPDLYSETLSVALGQCWDLDETYETLRRPIIDHYPQFHGFLRRAYSMYLKQWGGEQWSEIKYYNRVLEDLPEEYQDQFYANVFLRRYSLAHNSYNRELVDHERIKRGAIKLMQIAPNNDYYFEKGLRFFNKHGEYGEHYAYYEAVLKQFPELANKVTKKGKDTRYTRGLSIALEQNNQGYHRIHNYRASGASYGGSNIFDITYLKGQDAIIGAMSYEGVHILDKATGETLSKDKVYRKSCHELCVSKDEKYVATAWYSASKEEKDYRIKIYEIIEGELVEIKELLLGDDKISSFIFSPNGETLYLMASHPGEAPKHRGGLSLHKWAWKEQAEPDVIKEGGSKFASKMIYNEYDNEIIFLDGEIHTLKLDGSDEINSYESSLPKGAYFLDCEIFGGGRYLAATMYMKRNSRPLYIFDTQTKKLLQKVNFEMKNKSDKEYIFEMQPTSDANQWKITSVGGYYGISTWLLKKQTEAFSLDLTSYNVASGRAVYSMANEDDNDPTSPIYIGDDDGLISVWNYPEYIEGLNSTREKDSK